MTRKIKPNIFKEPLLFRVGAKPAVYFPPGALGNGECSSVASSGPETDSDQETCSVHSVQDYEDYGPNDYGSWECDSNSHYDDGLSLDNAPENELLYRSYDVFIHKADDPTSSRQLYVIHDFDYNQDGRIVANPSRFAVVCLLKVLKG